ncbi:hypothetical protein ONR49_26180 [Salmonella enterica subsp. enterica serovar Virginia]|nr:hypothetical protein [Salmonella enterica subsp. enterica serovar Virginia]
MRALKTGHNQIFLSASKTQAYVWQRANRPFPLPV